MFPKPLILSLLLCTACASATGNDPDAGRADARVRADAGDSDAALADAGAADDASPSPDAASGPANLLLTEIVDATLVGGLPKFAELTNIGGMPAELSGYSLGLYSNGSTTLSGNSSVVLSGTLAAGESYVISFEDGDAPGSGSFRTVYGFDPDNFAFGAVINGNDVLLLFLADGGGTGGAATGTGADATIVDGFGVVGAGGSPGGGTGEAWEYTDGYASRKPATAGPAVIFDINEWQLSGPNLLDGLDASGIAAVTSPGSF
jgi:hypothetical protein